MSQLEWLDQDFIPALEGSQFELHYQPKVHVRTGNVHGVEALLRCRHPLRGSISPVTMLAYTELRRRLGELCCRVIRTAAAQALDWSRHGIEVRVAVNIPPSQLRDKRVLDELGRSLAELKGCGAGLDIEIMETDPFTSPAALDALRGLRAEGAGIHLDNVGSGYSSLRQLARLPLDAVKIPGRFGRGSGSNESLQVAVRRTLALCHASGLQLVATRVEDEADARMLETIGVDFVQGHVFARPMSAEAFAAWRTARQAG